MVSDEDVLGTLQRMATVVDRQNAGDPAYTNMMPDWSRSVAFQCALDLGALLCCPPVGGWYSTSDFACRHGPCILVLVVAP